MNMAYDEVFGRVDFSVSTGLVPWGDPSEYVHTVSGKIIAYSETDEEIEAGEIVLRVVSVTEATNTGEDLLMFVMPIPPFWKASTPLCLKHRENSGKNSTSNPAVATLSFWRRSRLIPNSARQVSWFKPSKRLWRCLHQRDWWLLSRMGSN